MDTLYLTRPFNLRYVIWQRCGRYTPELLRTHRTARASWLYIHRQHGIDAAGPTPDWSVRNDLVAYGRCAPSRANDPALDGMALWTQADAYAMHIRPDEPTCAHAVGSLPLGGDPTSWRNLVEGFCEDNLASQGMVTDWAIHYRDSGDGHLIMPHFHALITARVYDRASQDCGRIRQNWVRSEKLCKGLTEKWWAHSGIYPASYIEVARRMAAPIAIARQQIDAVQLVGG